MSDFNPRIPKRSSKRAGGRDIFPSKSYWETERVRVKAYEKRREKQSEACKKLIEMCERNISLGIEVEYYRARLERALERLRNPKPYVYSYLSW